MNLPSRYDQELEDAIFQYGELKGRITTSMSMLTDALLMLNALELYYQKPSSKAVTPSELQHLRDSIASVKELLREAAVLKNGGS